MTRPKKKEWHAKRENGLGVGNHLLLIVSESRFLALKPSATNEKESRIQKPSNCELPRVVEGVEHKSSAFPSLCARQQPATSMAPRADSTHIRPRSTSIDTGPPFQPFWHIYKPGSTILKPHRPVQSSPEIHVARDSYSDQSPCRPPLYHLMAPKSPRHISKTPSTASLDPATNLFLALVHTEHRHPTRTTVETLFGTVESNWPVSALTVPRLSRKLLKPSSTQAPKSQTSVLSHFFDSAVAT